VNSGPALIASYVLGLATMRHGLESPSLEGPARRKAASHCGEGNSILRRQERRMTRMQRSNPAVGARDIWINPKC